MKRVCPLKRPFLWVGRLIKTAYRLRWQRRNAKIVNQELVRLFDSRGEDEGALKVLIENALGRPIYNTPFVEELARRMIYGETPE